MTNAKTKQAIPVSTFMPAAKEHMFPIARFTCTKGNTFTSLGKKMQGWELSNEASELGFRVGTRMSEVKFTIVGTRGDVNFTYYDTLYDDSGEDIVAWTYMPETAVDSQILDCAHVKVTIWND